MNEQLLFTVAVCMARERCRENAYHQHLLDLLYVSDVTVYSMATMVNNHPDVIGTKVHEYYEEGILNGLCTTPENMIYIDFAMIAKDENYHPYKTAIRLASIIIHELQHFKTSLTGIPGTDEDELRCIQEEREVYYGVKTYMTRSVVKDILAGL